MKKMFETTPGCREDAKELAELDAEVFSTPWSEKAFIDEFGNDIAVYYVARENGKIIGYAGFWHVADEGDITNVAVLPECRRKGVATALVGELVKEAKKRSLALLTLEVRCSNTAAIALYESFGFKIIGKRKRYYTNPTEDAHIMTLYFGGTYG